MRTDFIEPVYVGHHLKGRAYRPLRIILMGQWCAEYCKNTVTKEIDDKTFIFYYDRYKAVEEIVHNHCDCLGIELLG